MRRLEISDHSRDNAGLKYVYPVVSRRAGGVSIGINLSPEASCNFRCVYCQVPGLSRGKSAEVDIPQLEAELGQMLSVICQGDFFAKRVPVGSQQLKDFAVSGDGEPTSAPNFGDVVDCVIRVSAKRVETPPLPLVVITNGTLASEPAVQSAFKRLGAHKGRIWFKLDAVTRAGFDRINSTPLAAEDHLDRLEATARLCPTWIQRCVFGFEGTASDDEAEYLSVVRTLLADGVPLRGMLMYSLARPSQQPEAPKLRALSQAELEVRAEPFRRLGLDVSVHA